MGKSSFAGNVVGLGTTSKSPPAFIFQFKGQLPIYKAGRPFSTPMPETNALICGASGAIGNAVLKLLLEDPAYSKVLAWVRHELPIQNPKLSQVEIDFDAIAEQTAPFPVHHVFCTLGTTMKKAGSKDNFRKVDFEYVRDLAHWAADNSAEKFLVVSAIGASAGSKVFYSRTKGEMEEAVKDMQIPGTIIFRPSMLVGGKRSEFRFGEVIGGFFLTLFWPFLLGGLSKYRAIRPKTVASAMVETAKSGTMGAHVIDSAQMHTLSNVKRN